MRRAAFEDYLVTRYRIRNTGRPLGDPSAKSYCSKLARAEAVLRTNFDNADLSERGVDALSRQLRAQARGAGLNDNVVNDCISALKAYAQFRGEPSGRPKSMLENGPPPQPPPPRAPRIVTVPPPPDPDPLVAHMSVTGLLATHGAIMEELRRRGVVRTSNAPTGDYAETLFAKAFGWTLATNSALGYDAVDPEGTRFQIKCRRITEPNGSRQLSALRRLPEKSFDFMAAILLDRTYGVSRAVILPHAQVESRARFIAHTNSWLFMLTDDVWALPGARDVTAQVVAAAAAL